eukprot:gene6120-4401_t
MLLLLSLSFHARPHPAMTTPYAALHAVLLLAAYLFAAVRTAADLHHRPARESDVHLRQWVMLAAVACLSLMGAAAVPFFQEFQLLFIIAMSMCPAHTKNAVFTRLFAPAVMALPWLGAQKRADESDAEEDR